MNFGQLASLGSYLTRADNQNAAMKALIERFFIEYPNIEQNEHLSGADMIQFVTLWMRDARVVLDNQDTSLL